jgi:hypothetical protein
MTGASIGSLIARRNEFAQPYISFGSHQAAGFGFRRDYCSQLAALSGFCRSPDCGCCQSVWRCSPMTCRHCDRSGAERLIGSNVIDPIGWLINPARNEARGWQSHGAVYIFIILASYVCNEDRTWRQP